MTSLLIVTPHLRENSTGRAYVWWLLAQRLGWDAHVISYRGSAVWEPLRGSAFGRDCAFVDLPSAGDRSRHLAEYARGFDAVVAVKPLPDSLGVAIAAGRRSRFPLVIDIDDPDLEMRLSRGPLWRRVAWRVRFLRFWLAVRSPRALRRRGAIAVSNPALHAVYGGRMVPHARADPGESAPHDVGPLRVAFVGTARTHKGIDVLRAAVARLAPDAELTVTAPPPVDARPWEHWVGEGTVDEGERLVAACDVVALPSLASSFAEGQLPAKLIDAMIGGRVVIVSDIAPMPWAVGEAALTVRAGSVDDLTTALDRLRDPALRTRYAEALRARALRMFSVDALAPVLTALVEEARWAGSPRHLAPQAEARVRAEVRTTELSS